MIARTSDRFMPVDLMTWNPRGCLVSVIDDPMEAARASLAMRRAGFDAEDVRLAPSRELLERADAPAGHNPIARVLRRLFSLGDEGILGVDYLDEARRGHHLLIVHALHEELRARAHAVMAQHRAHAIRYYGRWVITDLPTL